MLPVRAAFAARRSGDDGRALVIRLIVQQARADVGFAPLPGALESGAVARRIVPGEELRIAADARGDEVLADFPESRAPFRVVRSKQPLAAPALERSLELPAQIDRILEAVVEAECAVGRVAVRRVAGDKYTPFAVALGDGDAQVPGPDVVEFAAHRAAHRLLDEASDVESLRLRALRQRRMEKPAFAHVDAAKKHPVAVEPRAHDAVGGALGKALEPLVQLAGAEHRQHHGLAEIRPLASDARLLAHHGARAIAADDVVGFEHFAPRPTVLFDRDARAAAVLFDGAGRPAEARVDPGERGELPPQYGFRAILRQPLVVLEKVGADELASGGRLPVLAHQAAVGGDFADRITGRHETRLPQLAGDSPEMEMLEGAMRQHLPFGNAVHAGAALDQRAGDATHAEVHGERRADRTGADDDDRGAAGQACARRRLPRPGAAASARCRPSGRA